MGDVEDARRVAAQLDIPHYVFDYSDEFNAKVVEPYVRRVRLRADARIRVSRATSTSSSVGCWSGPISSASTRWPPGITPAFARSPTARTAWFARDDLGQGSVVRVGRPHRSPTWPGSSFPVGEMTKAEVRARAAELGLRTAAKPESMDVCFVAREPIVRSSSRPAPERARASWSTLRSGAGRARRDRPVHDRSAAWPRRGDWCAAVRRRRRRRHEHGHDRSARSVAPCPRSRSRDLTFTHETPGGGCAAVRTGRARTGSPSPARLVDDRVEFLEPTAKVAPGQVVALYAGDVLVGGGVAA